MKQLNKWFLPVVLCGLMVMSGCYTVTQKGNKIFTDAPVPVAYSYAKQALQDKGYKIREEKQPQGSMDGSFIAEATPGTVLKDFKKPAGEFLVTVKNVPAEASSGKAPYTEVAFEATIKENDPPPEIKEEAAKVIAKNAVDDVRKELDLYTPFTLTKTNQITIANATPSKVYAYLESSLKQNGYQVSATPETSTVQAQKETPSPFNDPAQVTTAVVTQDQATQVNLSAAMKGNYNQAQASQQLDQYFNEVTALLGQYPIASQTMSKSYMYADLATARAFTVSSLKNLKFKNINATEQAVTGIEPSSNALVNIAMVTGPKGTALNVMGSLEGNLGDNKAGLDASIQVALQKLANELNAYQTSYNNSKLFSNINAVTATKYAKQVLGRLGATNIKVNGNVVTAKWPGQINAMAALEINEVGAEGTSIDVYGLVNQKMDSVKAQAYAKKIVDMILAGLSKFDKENLK